ncbi:MAG: iron ABC transporter permease, partial [Pseudomonadota bacterium]
MIRWAILIAILVTSVCLALRYGQISVPLDVLWNGLGTNDGPGSLILGTIRGPRVAVAMGGGFVLGLSGALFQTLFRNPLASPDVLGFTSGAGLAVIFAVSFNLAIAPTIAAVAGGVFAALVVAAIAYQKGVETPAITLILVGLGIGFFATGLATFLMTVLPTSSALEAQRWLSGSLSGSTWGNAGLVCGLGSLLALFALAQSRALGVLELGNDMAKGLGLSTEASRWTISGTGVLLAAVGVSLTGPVPFVALIAGPLGAVLSGATTVAGRLLAGGMAGAIVLVLADLVARVAIPNTQLPAGVFTGLIGAPFLLWRLGV